MIGLTAALAAGTSLAGLGMNMAQAIKANKEAAKARKANEEAEVRLRNLKEVNQLADLQVPTLGYELAQQGLDKSAQAAIQATQGAGAEGVLGGVGQINQGMNEAELKLADSMNKAEYARDMAIANEASRIGSDKFKQLDKLDLSVAEGAALAEQANANIKNRAIEGMFGSALSGINYADSAIDLYPGKGKQSVDPNIEGLDLSGFNLDEILKLGKGLGVK